jgi:hypothetical protein
LNERRGTYRPPDKRKRNNDSGNPNRDFHPHQGRGPHPPRQGGDGSNPYRPRNQNSQDHGPRHDHYHHRNRNPQGPPRERFNPGEPPNRNQQFGKPRPNGKPQPGRRPDGSFDVFELFCAYHLGITAEGNYRQQNINDMARRFNCTPAELKQALVDYHLDSDAMINSDFDLAMAQIDIMVAPEGVDKRELARPWFEESQKANPHARNWQREIEEDAKENAKIFGKGE